MLAPVREGVIALTTFFALGVLSRWALGVEEARLAFWFDPIVFEFVFGVFIALASRRGWRLPAGAAIAAAATGFLGVAWRASDPDAADAWNFLRLGLPAALFVCALALGPQWKKDGPVRVGVLIGDASYALYLSHPFVIRPLREIGNHLPAVWLSPASYAATCALAAIVVSVATHLAIEKPMNRYLREYLAPRTSVEPGWTT